MKPTYEVTDHPRLTRIAFAGTLLTFGIVVIAGATYNHQHSCFPGHTADLVGIWIGAITSVISICWMLAPVRAVRKLFQASSEGITMLGPDGAPLHAPWGRVGTISMESVDGAWNLKIPTDILERDRRRLRNIDGGFPRGADGYVDLMVPVFTKRRATRAVSTLKLLQQGGS